MSVEVDIDMNSLINDTYSFDEATVSWRTRVGNDYAIKWQVLATKSLKADSDNHVFKIGQEIFDLCFNLIKYWGGQSNRCSLLLFFCAFD